MSDQHDEAGRLPAPHPTFAAHFARPFYDPESDESYDVPPFGTDDGFDEIHDWSDRAEDLHRYPTLRYMLGEGLDGSEHLDEGDGLTEEDDIVIALGFTLLRITGQIDDEGRGGFAPPW